MSELSTNSGSASATDATGSSAPSQLDLSEHNFAQLTSIAEALHGRKSTEVGGLWGASQGFVLARLQERAQGPWLAITSSDAEAEAFLEDLEQFGAQPVLLPSRAGSGAGPSKNDRKGQFDNDALRARLEVARAQAGNPEERPRLMVASLSALLQPIPEIQDLEQHMLRLEKGDVLEVTALAKRLVNAGLERAPLVEQPGEFSLRGDILDLWPVAHAEPLRLEFFDSELESLRHFDPSEQRSTDSHDALQICLAGDTGGVEDGEGRLPFNLLAPTTVFVSVEPLRIADKREGLRIQSGSHARALLQFDEALKRHTQLKLQSLPGSHFSLDVRSVQSWSGDLNSLPARVQQTLAGSQGNQEDSQASSQEQIHLFARTEAEAQRLSALFIDTPLADQVRSHVGAISKGFHFPGASLIGCNYRELVGMHGVSRARKKTDQYRTRALRSFFELKPGDYVVHAVHGMARFMGLKLLERSGGEEEHLHLTFAGEVSLFVPVARIDLVQRYIGTGAGAVGAPPLDKIGGGAFRKRKERVQKALVDLAGQLLEVQAQRELKKRKPWSGDRDMQEQMIDAFPYTETEDQLTTDNEIHNDLTRDRPMDRLLCGDVGFGKTEMAIRAAFRVVSGGGQVAILAPTTVLANQHYETFRARLATFPVEVGVLSRYVTGKQAKETIAKASIGQLDILVGTHRILSKDVKLPNLGLVIIDEEQRFGVTHKEHFKKFRADVDVLTLSATPIPRTLHMSLAGVRDISALTMPPPGRKGVETKLIYNTDVDQIREALLREKNRDGQAFFLYNRVESIQARANELARLVPECTFGIGHGQMGARELKGVMDSFSRHGFDVLVASTIIENGLDIPAAGTIFIDEADRFGLSEMHQLRGRVGRGSQRAYCYLILDKLKPIRDIARERLKALEELQHIGAGFAISMKDLEIRGAGNILGPEQSGHIGAVGYDMYCRLLKSTVAQVKIGGNPLDKEALRDASEGGVELELGLRAFLPEEWIPSQETRIEILRDLDEVATPEQAKAALATLRDRFGRVPKEARELVRQFLFRAQLGERGIRRLAWREDSYIVDYTDRLELEAWLSTTAKGAELRPLRHGQALLVPPKRLHKNAQKASEWLEGKSV